MLGRRAVTLTLALAPFIGIAKGVRSQNMSNDVPFDQLDYPPLANLDGLQLFGYQPATEAQKQKARLIINTTPTGPTPIDIAQSFVDRFYNVDPEAISQWPAPANWNPLVVEFFKATSTKANNDMIAWCAAFANWCITRAGAKGSRNASSQSFLASKFKRTMMPKRGDLTVFTCYDLATGKSLGLGHVTFFKSRIDDGHIEVVGGNQSSGGHGSIVSAELFPILPRKVRRHVGGRYVPCEMRLNTYIALS